MDVFGPFQKQYMGQTTHHVVIVQKTVGNMELVVSINIWCIQVLTI